MTDRRLVVGIDGSPVAAEALRWAARLARLIDAELVVVHAAGLLEASLQPKLIDVVENEWCASLRASAVPVTVVVRVGHPVDVLVEQARQDDADLVVVGSRGDGGSPALSLGSTSLRLLQVAPCPVLVVPGREEAGRHLGLRRMLVAVEEPEPGLTGVEMACDLAVAVGASVDIVHAVEEVDVFPLGPATSVSCAREWEAPRVAAARLEPLRAYARRRGIPVQVRVQRGEPGDVVVDVAAAIDADLVVLTSRQVDGPTRPLLESVSRRIVRLAHRPTVVLPVRATAPG